MRRQKIYKTYIYVEKLKPEGIDTNKNDLNKRSKRQKRPIQFAFGYCLAYFTGILEKRKAEKMAISQLE